MIDSGSLSAVGPERKQAWENGWSENLHNFLEADGDINELIPRYYRPGQVLSLDRNYITTSNPNVEFDFFRVLRLWLFQKYLTDAESVYEFGCGPGHNLASLAQLYPDKKLHGLDWTTSARDLINKIAEKYKYKLTGHLFDMFSPDETLEFEDNSTAVTFGALEQLDQNFEPFLRFIINKRPALCLNVEPVRELYDDNYLYDYIAIKCLEKRKYLSGFLDRLKQLENEGSIEIIKTQRVFFGNVYYEGWSFVVWRPKSS